MPSAVIVNCGLGRRKAVISSAFISSTLSASAFSAGLTASNFVLVCSHVKLCCAAAGSAAPNRIPANPMPQVCLSRNLEICMSVLGCCIRKAY